MPLPFAILPPMAGHLVAVENVQVPPEVPALYERVALLVYTGSFETMDKDENGDPIVADISAADINRMVKVHNARLARLTEFFGRNEMAIPLKFYPPMQVDHSVSAMRTVGRLVGRLWADDYVLPETGEKRLGLYGLTRTLGKENVERVIDGRWTNLSLGAFFEVGRINELTITPFAAAADASFLSAAQGGANYRRLSAATGGSDMYDEKKMASHLMAETKCSEEEAMSRLSAMSEEERESVWKKCSAPEEKKAEGEPPVVEKNLSAGVEGGETTQGTEAPKEEKLAAPADGAAIGEQKKTPEQEEQGEHAVKMSAPAREKLTKLMAGFRANGAKVRMESRKGEIATKLSGLRRRMKITPAEIKNLNLDEMAGKSSEVVTAMLDTYEKRETPVIIPGMIGTVKAVSLSAFNGVKREDRIDELADETISHMPFTQKSVRLSRVAAGLPADAPRETKLPANSGIPLPVSKLFRDLVAEMAEVIPTGGKEKAMELALTRLSKAGAGETISLDRDEEMPYHESQEHRLSIGATLKEMEAQFEELVALVGAE